MEIGRCIEAIAQGNIEALELLYSIMRVPVYTLARSIVREHGLAEDLTQDTFVRIYANAAKYRPGTEPRAWIITIARNLSYNQLRDRKRVTHLDDDVADGDRVPIGDTSDLAINHAELLHGLMQLPVQDREIVVLKAIAGFKHAEIAVLLQLPEGTTRWKYRKAINQLQRIIGGAACGQ